MQPVSWSRRLVRVGIFWLVVAAFGLAGCSSGVGVPIPGTGPLVTVEMQGGMCPDDMCGDNSVILERDGRVHGAAKPPNELGRVNGDNYAALDLAIRSTDFAAVKSKPFTGECPIAFDGQKLIFTFAIGSTTQQIDSCETEIDWSSPLFIAVTTALGEWIPIPFS